MLSENRLKRKTIGQKPDQTYEDYQDTSKNDTLYNIIKVGLIGATTYGLYKTGALKAISKPLLELADKVASKGGDTAAATMSAVHKWANLKELSSSQLFRSTTQSHTPPNRSLFRNRDTSFLYDLAEDLRNGHRNGRYKFENLSRLQQDTTADIRLLFDMIGESKTTRAASKGSFKETDLNFKIKQRNEFLKTLKENAAKQDPEQMLMTSKANETLIQDILADDATMAQELKESGYRKMLLSDIFEYNTDGEFVVKQNKPKGLSDDFIEDLKRAVGQNFGTDVRYTKDGKGTTLFGSGDWKNVIIDSAIRIDEKGNMIDYRMAKKDIIGFAHSLANDFGLPVVQFNPFKSIFHLDKIGRKQPLMGMLSPEQFVPGITRIGGHGDEAKLGNWLGDTFGEKFRNKNVSVFGEKAYINDGNKLIQIADNLRLIDITYADEQYGLKPMHNAFRQISNLELGHYDPKSKFAKLFGLGSQEILNEQEEIARRFDNLTSIDEITDKFLGNISDKAMYKALNLKELGYDTLDDFLQEIKATEGFNFKSTFGQGFAKNGKHQPRMFDVTPKGFTFEDSMTGIYESLKKGDTGDAYENLKKFVAQYFVGRNADNHLNEYATERSGGFIWNILNGVADGARAVHLGLPTESKRSTLIMCRDLLLKRALPIYAALQIPGMINYFTEPFFGDEDENGNRDNITKFMMRDVVKPIDIGAHHLMDLTGATKLFKFLGDMTPGSDQISELPGIHALGLGQTAEERKDYIENGYDPIRKGRWWGSGNTPFTGSKIMYFRPNLYRRVEADVDFSDSKWGSRQEYYNNAWFPNPVNPFAPINHFITDRHHYDKKHYYDRPYLQTAPEGSNIPIIGPLFSNTIGKVIMPQKKMHLEYWRNGLQVDPNDESPSPLLTDGSLSDVQAAGSFGIRRSFNVSNIQQAKIDITEYNNIQLRQQQVNKLYQEQLGVAQYQAKKVLSKSFIDKSGITFEQRNILPYRSYDRYDNKYEAYSTPSGALNVVDVPDELNLYDVNKDLQRYSINKVIGTNQRVDVNDIDSPSIPVGNDSKSVDNAFIYGLGEQYNWLSEVAGLKGFALQQFVTGHGNEKARVIEDSGYAYSWNKDFWDANMGGLGGNLSEITRRFIPKRNNNTEFVNPIRNTMPSWMPGSNYFTDFKHGDPYSKIENGEERLPGEGYERLNHINGLMNLNIGSSSIGYDKAYIVRHMLKQDKVKNTFEEDTLETGTKLHAEIEKSWKDAGLAISTEGEIKDTENGIVGYYDAIVKDPTSKTGISIVDIKTTSAKKLDEIRKAGKPLDHHQRQVNYYLWATKNQDSKGYIYYVDKENPNNNYTVGFNYDNNMLKDTLNNVYAARKEIRDAIQNGVIGRGELYSTMDKFRILADVAPYSQEFKDVSAQLSSEDLSKEEKEEASQIRERVKQQKEPLRVYDYRFKTANLQKQTVTVDKIIDNNTIVTKEYGKEHSIKFAGINVSESNSEYYKTWDEEYKDKRGRKRKRKTGITMNDAARNEIRKYIRPGQRITIEYDADDTKKFSKDSTRSIRAVVTSRGRNVNKVLLDKQLAKEKDDDSPAGIHARYTKGEIAFGSAMETLTHDVVGRIPFVGSKFLQVRSPYEQYRKREVYSKDFQSWNHPIRDLLIPSIQENIGDNSLGGLGGIIAGAFIGSMFGRKGSKFGALVGATLGGLIPAIGKIGVTVTHHDKDRDWRPKRRRDQEELNEYVDTLKYVKNMRLYEQYKIKSLKEDHFDVEKFMKSKEAAGVSNKLRQQELTDFKRKVKLDFKHRDRYNFKYGKPKYVDMKMDKKATISAINQELSELQSQRKVTKLPANALKAIQYKQTADKTMYGYNPGDSLVNIMSALPKKDRQYFKHFIDAPEEEKGKILRIAPEYLRRALQSTWGMKVDKKPSLNEYFQTHGLPDASWVGWDENTNIDDVKVKLVHQNKMDPGEFDIWDDNKKQADQTNIPIPMINARNSARQTQLKLTQILGKAGYDNVQVDYMTNSVGKNNTKIHVKHDARDDVESQIASLDYENM